MRSYHDAEWGVPERDGRELWEALVLDGFQAGLSWITILRQREAFREEFRGFDPEVVAKFGEREIARALANPGIVRSRAKIEATIANARAYLKMEDAGEGLSSFAWSLVGDSPAKIRGDVPAKTPLSESISVALKKRGYKFVGPTTEYAWMQAKGLVNDHVAGCFRRSEV
jgi:DNA-3-methyladenine glycosylase I